MRFSTSIPESVKTTLPYRGIRAVVLFRQTDKYRHIRQRFRRDSKRIDAYFASTPDPKIHFGCGLNPIEGWLNTDYYPNDPAIPHLDLTSCFPLPDGSLALAFSEHVIEHLPLAGGINMLRESFRVLRPGGRIRISTPALPALLAIYQQPDETAHRAYLDWHADTWLGDADLTTPAVVLNDFARNWGHLIIYDPETLCKIIEMAGFEQIRRCELQKSEDQRLAGLENETRMPPGLLALHTMTFEAVKPETAQVSG